jgi:hypothetical protein
MRPSKKHAGLVVTIACLTFRDLGMELTGLYLHRPHSRSFSFLVVGRQTPCLFDRSEWIVVSRPT